MHGYEKAKQYKIQVFIRAQSLKFWKIFNIMALLLSGFHELYYVSRMCVT